MKKMIIPIGYLLMGVFFARCDFLQGIYPLGIALITITYLSKNFFYIFLGALAGALTISFEPSRMLINSLSYFLLLPCVLVLRKNKTERLAFSMLLGFLVFLVPASTLRIDTYSRIVLVFSGLFATFLTPVLKRIYISIKEIDCRLSLEEADIVAICFLGAIAISSLPKTDILGFDLRIFTMLATSSLAILAFSARGGIWSAILGIMWVIKGGDVTTALSIITGGILAGMLQKKKGGIMLGFILGNGIISLFMLNTISLSLGILNLILGCGYTVFLKENVVHRLKRLAGVHSGVNDLEMHYIEGLRKTQKTKIERAGRMYLQLSKAFVSVDHGEGFKQKIVNEALNVCKNCSKQEYCHKNRKSDTILELNHSAEKIIEKGKISNLPITLTARCIQPMDLVKALQDSYNLNKHYFEENPSSETELALQLKSIADMLFALSDDISKLPEFDKDIENQARDIISARIGAVKEISCRKSGESHIISVSVKENEKDMGEKIASALYQGYLGSYRFLTGGTDKNGGFYGEFAPKTKYNIEAHALRQNKSGQKVCGDSFTYLQGETNKYIAAISDGAGSGFRAKKESEGALDLLEALWEADIKREDAFLIMNRLLLLKGEKEDYSTVDVTELDLENGVLYWTKIGAVPGYIIRENTVEKIESGALPMGIVTKINPVTTKKLVKQGDIIVLVTDGVYDGLNNGNEDKIKEMLFDLKKESPKCIAENILNSAQRTGINDDMTVLVLKVSVA